MAERKASSARRCYSNLCHSPPDCPIAACILLSGRPAARAIAGEIVTDHLRWRAGGPVLGATSWLPSHTLRVLNGAAEAQRLVPHALHAGGRRNLQLIAGLVQYVA